IKGYVSFKLRGKIGGWVIGNNGDIGGGDGRGLSFLFCLRIKKVASGGAGCGILEIVGIGKINERGVEALCAINCV
ncbi:hypothetical protein, partial [Staphylococcus saprophyticus]|uniref:hypothetical protein n=1 Tax=Staphylococcus saprophyticus TaxID=29385 RepID=UPI001C92E2D9